MWIVDLRENPNGSHNDHRAEHITAVPDGWAMIPADFPVPDTFPFVSVEAEEKTYTRTVQTEGTDGERVTEQMLYTMMTVVAMTEGIVPDAPAAVPSQLDVLEAQVTYTAMMTDTLLEV